MVDVIFLLIQEPVKKIRARFTRDYVNKAIQFTTYALVLPYDKVFDNNLLILKTPYIYKQIRIVVILNLTHFLDMARFGFVEFWTLDKRVHGILSFPRLVTNMDDILNYLCKLQIFIIHYSPNVK